MQGDITKNGVYNCQGAGKYGLSFYLWFLYNNNNNNNNNNDNNNYNNNNNTITTTTTTTTTTTNTTTTTTTTTNNNNNCIPFSLYVFLNNLYYDVCEASENILVYILLCFFIVLLCVCICLIYYRL